MLKKKKDPSQLFHYILNTGKCSSGPNTVSILVALKTTFHNKLGPRHSYKKYTFGLITYP